MEVDDFNLVMDLIATSGTNDSSNPGYAYSPIANLASALGADEATSFSQLAALRALSIGKLKVHIDTLAINALNDNQNVRDRIWIVWGIFACNSGEADGTITVQMQNMNPFINSVTPVGDESMKDPWNATEGSMDACGPRWLMIKRKCCWVGNPQTAYVDRTQINLRTKRGMRLRDIQTLYYAQWWYGSLVNNTSNDLRILSDVHIGVPKRFLN